jgi:cell division protein FtsW
MARAAATRNQQERPRPRAPRARRAPRGAPQPLEYQILLTVTLCLLAVGAVMVYSASSARTLLPGHGDATTYLLRYVMYGTVGLVAMHLLSRRGLEAVPRLTTPLLVLAFGLLVAVRFGGVEVNGARRWLGAGPLQFQPSELMKLALVLYAARLLARRPAVARNPRDMVPLGLVVGVACVLIAMQPDLGTTLVVAFSMVAVLIAAGIPLRHLMVIAGLGAALVAVYAASAPYRRARLTAFWDPWAHADTIGYQFVQGQIAIGSGGLFGRGLGQSVQKIFYLPEAHTDFILAIIGEELGVAGIFGVLTLYAMLAYAGLRVAQKALGPYAKLLAGGLTSVIMCQALLNAFAVLGVAPLTGVPLPFISYGSTNLVVLLAAVGLLLNIAVTGGVQLRVVEEPRRDRRGRGWRRDDRPVRAVRGQRSKPGRRDDRPAASSRDGRNAKRSWRDEGGDSRGRDRGPRGAGPRGRGRAAG